MDDSGSEGSDDGDLQLLSRGELEQRVRARTEALRNLMDTMVDVLIELDDEGRISRTNAAVESVLGYDPAAVVGKPVDVLFAAPAENEGLTDMLTSEEFTERLLVEGQVTDAEVRFETAGGEPIPMSVSASVMDEEESGGVVCVAKDISERKAAERRADFLHSMLRHDLGNKLQIVDGYLDILGEESEDVDEDLLAEVRHNVDGAIELVENVRTLNRVGGQEDTRTIELATVLQNCVRSYEEQIDREGFDVDLSLGEAPRVVAGELLSELFENLLENALVHSGGDRIRIAVDRADDHAVVTVEDDGRGVPDERKGEILQRGVKGPGSEGSGLGTHIAARIAETYGGRIEVGDSGMGGARFDVFLPRA